MKNSGENKFQTKVLINVLYSLVITCLVEFFLVNNVTAITKFYAETLSPNSKALGFVYTETIVVLLFVFLGIGLFSALFFWLTKRELTYIDHISSAITRISTGDLQTKLEIVGDDEFSAMAEKINTMVDEINALMEKERYAEKTKNELITNVAHDLRTPLTSIIGYLELLNRSENLPAQMRHNYLQIVYQKARRLQQLIEDLFGFTKLNYGKMAMNVGKMDIVKLLAQLMDEFYPNFMEKGLAFSLKSSVDAQVIVADSNLLARLFDNLINNAIKYGADGKRIDVRIDVDGDYVIVQVINYGKVIPADELPLIFDKFYRVEQSRSTNTGGTGLGLAIAQNIVQMHGGEISVRSDMHGTAFIVKLQIDFDITKENFQNA